MKHLPFPVLASAAFILIMSGCQPDRPKTKDLPFLWGTATAGFQSDMGCPSGPCDDSNSDWWVWTHDQVNIRQGYTGGGLPEDSAGNWELYPRDLGLANQMIHTNAYRFSFEWSRIFPHSTEGATTPAEVDALANPGAVEHYHRLLEEVRKNHMEPVVTLMHYTLPLWVHDPFAIWEELGSTLHVDLQPPYERSGRKGWLEPEFITREFAKYAAFAAREFGEEVDIWLTENEPVAVVAPGFLLLFPSLYGRTNPPGIADPALALAVYEAMIEAHCKAYEAIKGSDAWDANGDGSKATVGPVLNFIPFEPDNPDSAADQQAAAHGEYLYMGMFLKGVTLGEYDSDLDMAPDSIRPQWKDHADFIGVNFYYGMRVKGISPLSLEVPILDFFPTENELYEPEALLRMMDQVFEVGLPCYITEAGGETRGEQGGEQLLVDVLSYVLQARDEGKQVKGYFWWSLVDNLEWNQGYDEVRSGMLTWDPATKERIVRPVVGLYQRIIEANGLPEDVKAEYGVESR